MPVPRPLNLIAELTYRCPLRCPYCSNPVGYEQTPDLLSADAWGRVFREAGDLGVLHVGLTGGEPSVRRDLEQIVEGAARARLFPHLVTAGTPLDAPGLERLIAAGLRSVQLSIQDSLPDESDRIAGAPSFERKLALARAVRSRGLPLIVNVVLHRHNLGRVREIIDLARDLDAERLELANTQYHGFALHNREALLPSRTQLDTAARIVREERERPGSALEILYVLPDYWSDRPKPCMGGWGQKSIVVTPAGTVLPCQAAATIPGLEFFSVEGHSLEACWSDAPGMNAFRGEEWMCEPCRSCPERGRDHGGCRCQAFALLGSAEATDPTCSLSPRHDVVVRARGETAKRFHHRAPRARMGTHHG